MVDPEQIASIVIAKTDEYLKIPSVVGHEKPFLDHLRKEYEELGYTVIRDDNIVAVSGNKPDSTYLSAHVDRHGILSIGNGDYRYAAHAIKNYKYNDDEVSDNLSHLEEICSLFEKEDVYAYGRWSGDVITSGTVRRCHFCGNRSNLVFNIDDMEEMPEGVPLAYKHDVIEKGDYIAGQLDNALCVGLIYALFKAGFQGTAFFTAEEEIGKSWKHLSSYLKAHNIETDRLIVLDTSPYDNTDYADAGKVILRNRDSFGTFNGDLVEELKSICEEAGLPYDMKDETLLAQGRKKNQLGRTELGRLIHENRRRWTGATVQIPTFNYHSNNESTTRLAVVNALQLLNKYF